jgi:uncharacterized protein (TIGR01741 family)
MVKNRCLYAYPTQNRKKDGKKMENELRELYNKMAKQLSLMVPTEWEKIFLLGEVEKDQLSYSVTFYFIEKTSKDIVRCIDIPDIYNVSEERYDELDDELSGLILALNDCFKNNGQELWEQVILVIDCDGNFNVDFRYDVMVDTDPLEREIIWAYDTFGYVPKEGTYPREELDKYLSSKTGRNNTR